MAVKKKTKAPAKAKAPAKKGPAPAKKKAAPAKKKAAAAKKKAAPAKKKAAAAKKKAAPAKKKARPGTLPHRAAPPEDGERKSIIPSVPPAEARRSLPPERPSRPTRPSSGAGRRIPLPEGIRSASDVHLLVVDDEPEVLNLLVPHLKKRGFTVSEAEDGDQALEKILTDRPHVVLLDVMMPGLTGWEISQYVRDREELDGVRIVMATGIGEEMNAATAPLYGADAYIDKPFRLEDVERAIVDVLARVERGELGHKP